MEEQKQHSPGKQRDLDSSPSFAGSLCVLTCKMELITSISRVSYWEVARYIWETLSSWRAPPLACLLTTTEYITRVDYVDKHPIPSLFKTPGWGRSGASMET